MFKGAKYADPVFSWYIPVGVTDIQFYHSDNLGDKYKDNIFVGDVNNGNLYLFTLNHNRTGLDFGGNDGRPQQPVLNELQNLDNASPVLDIRNATRLNTELSSSITIGKEFSAITDIETGPDGYLYVLSYLDGKLYKVFANAALT
jgi:glucose/arabinose dehydrogenase